MTLVAPPSRQRPLAPWLAMMLLAGCHGGAPTAVDSGGPEAVVREGRQPAERWTPQASDAAAARYAGIYAAPVTLTDGVYEGPPFVEKGASRPRVTLLEGFALHGDLDGDGGAESAFLLSENSGGSGDFLYLVVLAGRGDSLANPGTVLLGDRIQVREAHIEDGTIVLDLIQAGASDAACCPGEKATRRFRLTATGLEETGAVVTGRLGLADLEGIEWVLAADAPGEAAALEPRITLRFEDGRVQGTSGCNGYFGPVTPGKLPGSITVGPLGSTMMACAADVMERELRFQRALENVQKYSFLAARLALTYRGADGGCESLIFDPTPLAATR